MVGIPIHTVGISIHALLAESDSAVPWVPSPRAIFLSTLSLRRATVCFAGAASAPDISIHALLAESDPLSFASCFTALLFLSTLSLRRATLASKQNPTQQRNFYPRSPCGERPSTLDSCSVCSSNFYPRSPCGERQYQ